MGLDEEEELSDESEDTGELEELEDIGVLDEFDDIGPLGVDTPVLSLGMVEEVLLQAAKEKTKSPNTNRCFAFMIIPPLLFFS